MEIFLILMLFFLFVIAFPFLFEVRLFVNVLDNFGMITFKFCGIRVYFAKLKIRGRNIVVKTKRKRSYREIELSSEKIDFAQNFFQELTEVLALRKLCVYSNVGVGNPFYSALVGGILENATNALALKLKSKRPHADFVILNNTNFEKASIVLSVRIRFFITLLDTGLGFLRAVKKTRKEEIEQWKQNCNKAK